MRKKLEWEKIVRRSSEKHNNKYSYTIQDYKNGKCKIEIFCRSHGNFKQSIESHLNGRGCPKCANNIKYTISTLIEKINSIHGDKYTYDFEGFKNNESLININCKMHGSFRMKVSNHLHGQECKYCSHTVYTNEEFLERCSNLHNNYYDYRLVEYKNYKSKISIICPKHGIFVQNARTHFRGHGCPSCKLSKGEIKIKGILVEKNINFEKQKKFEKCYYKEKLSFDFYLPDFNVCLEYDGYQHFNSVEFFGGEESFEKQKIRDIIKDNYCLNNNIKLYRIRYDENIEKELNKILNELPI